MNQLNQTKKLNQQAEPTFTTVLKNAAFAAFFN